jgi:vancomycin aglycone glucosyltransferase
MLWDWDQTPLPAELETFLTNGAPPIYLGFGSMRAADQAGHVLLETVRALGLRAILSQGWAGLTPAEASPDILSIGDVSHAQLFPRVAAVVHHGGAGTTTTAARAGRPQVIVPHNYDQFFWAHRIQQLGLGTSGPTRDDLTVETLLPILQNALQPAIAQQAQSLAAHIEPHGARLAAQRLLAEFA